MLTLTPVRVRVRVRVRGRVRATTESRMALEWRCCDRSYWTQTLTLSLILTLIAVEMLR